MIAAIYLLKVTLCSGILLGYYWLALRNKAFHQWNRFYLLAITAISLLLPFIQIPVAYDSAEVVRYISAASIDDSIILVTKQKPYISLSTAQWLTLFYLLVAALLLALVLKAAKGIADVLKSYPRQKLENIFFLNTDASGAPFSFLNYMVWNRDIELQSETGKHIFRHELVHIQQKHTLDKIFLLIVLIPFWINPFFWIIRKELNAVHEFIADESALQDGSADELSRMILNALYPKHAYLLTSPFFQTSIKRRLQMFAIKNQKINYMTRILVLPILFIVVAAFTVTQETQKEKETFSEPQLLTAFGDTVPKENPNVIVEEIPKAVTNGVIVEEISKKDTTPRNAGKGIIADTENKIYLESDEIIYKIHPNETSTRATTALLVVNGEKMENEILREKTIVSKRVTVYPKNDKEAIGLFGNEAAGGTMVFEDAKIISKAESKIYQEAQRDTVPKKDEEKNQVFTKMQVEPKFAGDWQPFLRKNLDATVPVTHGAKAGSYEVRIKFIVDKEGNLSQFEPLTKHGYGMEDEVINLLKKSPAWEPGMQNGRKVNAYKIQKVTFVISE